MNEFHNDLARSHIHSKLPFWKECYTVAFPTMIGMDYHQEDSPRQRLGVDRTIDLPDGKQILIDEKIRGVNKKTRETYPDIFLEWLSCQETGSPGWVVKPLLADYIAYAIVPLGKFYLLPVPQLQQAWRANEGKWRFTYWYKKAMNVEKGKREEASRDYHTISTPVPPEVLFEAVENCLEVNFTPIPNFSL